MIVLVIALFSPDGGPAMVSADRSALDSLLRAKESELLTVRDQMQSNYASFVASASPSCGTGDRLPSLCAAALPKSATCNPAYGHTRGCSCDGSGGSSGGAPIDSDAVGALQSGTSSASDVLTLACEFGDMRAVFRSGASGADHFRWIYYGTEQGAFAIYPHHLWALNKTGQCGGATYDPRFRPWYAAGASGPRNVLMVIDKSGSMANGGRMASAKAAARLIVDGLTQNDWVGAVAFSNEDDVQATFGGQLRRASEETRCELKDWIDGLSAGGNTAMKAAFERAAEMLADTPKASECKTAVVFLTDGEPNPADQNPSDFVRAQFKASDKRFLFAFTLGVARQETRDLIDEITCAAGGISQHIGDGDGNALKRLMASYFRFFAAQAQSASDNSVVRWSEPYISIPNIWGPVVSATVPVFDQTVSNPTRLLGVLSADLALCELEEALGSSNEDEIRAALLEASASCWKEAFTECQAQVLRENKCPSSSCRVGTSGYADALAKMENRKVIPVGSGASPWLSGFAQETSPQRAERWNDAPCGDGCAAEAPPQCGPGACESSGGADAPLACAGGSGKTLSRGGVIALAAVGGALGLVGLVAGAVLFWKKRQRGRPPPAPAFVTSNPPPPLVPGGGAGGRRSLEMVPLGPLPDPVLAAEQQQHQRYPPPYPAPPPPMGIPVVVEEHRQGQQRQHEAYPQPPYYGGGPAMMAAHVSPPPPYPNYGGIGPDSRAAFM